jgi:hypothetical protein
LLRNLTGRAGQAKERKKADIILKNNFSGGSAVYPPLAAPKATRALANEESEREIFFFACRAEASSLGVASGEAWVAKAGVFLISCFRDRDSVFYDLPNVPLFQHFNIPNCVSNDHRPKRQSQGSD